MSSETWFKVAFVVAFIWAVAAAATTARQATRRHGGGLNQLAHEVRGLIALRATLGLVFYAMLAVWLFRSAPPEWARFPVSPSLRWMALGLLLPILVFFTWSFRSLGTNYRGGVGLYDDHELVTTGAYHWIRHPIYAAFIGIMLLVLVLSANWILGVAGVLLVASIAAARIPTEDRELHERFGADWQRYAEHTSRLLPRLPRSHSNASGLTAEQTRDTPNPD